MMARYDMYYTDIKYAVSEDGGATFERFEAPQHAAGNPDESDAFPAAYDWLMQEGNEYTINFMYLTDAIPGVSLFADNNEASEDSYWSYETLTFTAEPNSVEDGEVPVTFALDQNYPNPFNPSTTIKYSVPEMSDVSLKVYDVLGKEVATLVDAAQIGSHTVEFDASNLASGLYIYTLKAGSFTSSKKMMLMK
ncbi:MAG: T9SS type A sorting domain-containing protein [Melioribacteraceae bacterium]|nr:T9SS type A sorting domain-containing protein [Melioribacteraceae bacterium]